MKDKVIEAVYRVLQMEYLRKINMADKSTREIIDAGIFPLNWNDYSYERRINALNKSMENGLSLEENIVFDENNYTSFDRKV